MTSETTILVVGATGTLGRLITRELQAQPGVRVRALVRPGSEAKAADALGPEVELVTGALSSEHAALVQACRGAFAVVSAVQGGPEVIVDGQLALLRAAAEAGVRRFIPSDFSFDIFGLAPGRNINTDWRRTFAERAAEAGGEVQVVHVLNGCFLDVGVLFGFLGAFDLAEGTMALWGGGRTPMDFTTYADTARYTALAATRPDVPERFEVAGDTLDAWGLKAALEAETGRSLQVVEHGSLADLDARIEGPPLSMARFRPNLVVSGSEPFAEDEWSSLRIGAIDFAGVKRCDRCVLTTVDPWTGETGPEPLRTLATYRRWHGKVWFGMNLVPRDEGVLQVGDAIVPGAG
ncbi:MAG: MOSC domain-containing protein [Myxococcales bacterium]|nr:MOSC domain-containing protein [Myxococcales bacterium]